jgi:hypothetical protein
MRLTIKLIFILFLLLLASSFLLITHGCGKEEAPNGATITAPTNLGTPHNSGGDCYPALVFSVKDLNGDPLSGVGVEIFSNGLIALSPALSAPTCNDVNANSPNAIATRTDSYGNVTVEMVTLPTITGGTSFVEVESGSASGVATTPPTVN